MKATGTQGMYANLRMTRAIDTDFHKVVIVDQFCQSSINKGVKQNFLLSHRWKIELLPNKVLLSDGKKTWSFLVEDEELISSATI